MRYETRTRWTGSTGVGWESYDRAHTAGATPAEQELTLTTGESKGDPRHLNPEQLLSLLTTEIPKEMRAPGTWMHDALQLRDQWESKLLRTSAWSPLY